jgi:intraflagellar transport protein 172
MFVVDRANMKAVEAAIDSRQWSKAVQILELQDSSSSSKYYKRIADHYASIGDYDVRYKSRKSLENSSLDIYNKNKFKYSLYYFQQIFLICHGNQV